MVRILLFLLPLSLFAISLQERVAYIIGEHKFIQNRLVINTVFSDSSRFYKEDGSIDMLKVVRTLQRLGLIPQTYKEARAEEIEFITYSRNPLFFKLAFDALDEAAVFNYSIEEMAQDSDSGIVRISFVSTLVPNPLKIMRFLQKNGVKVLTLSHIDGVWRYILDFSNAFLAAPKLEKVLHFSTIRHPIWIRVKGAKRVIVRAKPKNHWHPKLYVFNERFEPVEVIAKREQLLQIVLRLPKGDYYIKIADTFAISNMQYGIDVFAK